MRSEERQVGPSCAKLRRNLAQLGAEKKMQKQMAHVRAQVRARSRTLGLKLAFGLSAIRGQKKRGGGATWSNLECEILENVISIDDPPTTMEDLREDLVRI